jgi:hypothetical protein
MRSRGHIWLFVVGVAAVLGGLAMMLPKGTASQSAARVEKRQKAVQPDEATRQMMQKLAGYESWAMFSSHAEKPAEQSEAHPGLWSVRYYNATARRALRREAWRFPAGSALVDEERPGPDAPPTELTAMIKQASGDWYWIQYTPDGRVMTKKRAPLSGQVGGCILCHSQARQDMVFTAHLE